MIKILLGLVLLAALTEATVIETCTDVAANQCDEGGCKCKTASSSTGLVVANIAECIAYTKEQGMTKFSFRSDAGYCTPNTNCNQQATSSTDWGYYFVDEECVPECVINTECESCKCGSASATTGITANSLQDCMIYVESQGKSFFSFRMDKGYCTADTGECGQQDGVNENWGYYSFACATEAPEPVVTEPQSEVVTEPPATEAPHTEAPIITTPPNASCELTKKCGACKCAGPTPDDLEETTLNECLELAMQNNKPTFSYRTDKKWCILADDTLADDTCEKTNSNSPDWGIYTQECWEEQPVPEDWICTASKQCYGGCKCPGAGKENAEDNVESLADCIQLARDKIHDHFSYRSDKKYCIMHDEDCVPTDTAASQWGYYDVVCTDPEATEAPTEPPAVCAWYPMCQEGKTCKCDAVHSGNLFHADDLQACKDEAMDKGATYANYRSDNNKCSLVYDWFACTTKETSNKAQWQVYESKCACSEYVDSAGCTNSELICEWGTNGCSEATAESRRRKV